MTPNDHPPEPAAMPSCSLGLVVTGVVAAAVVGCILLLAAILGGRFQWLVTAGFTLVPAVLGVVVVWPLAIRLRTRLVRAACGAAGPLVVGVGGSLVLGMISYADPPRQTLDESVRVSGKSRRNDVVRGEPGPRGPWVRQMTIPTALAGRVRRSGSSLGFFTPPDYD